MEIPSTDSTALMAAAKIIGVNCAQENQEFLICKEKDQNPQACLPQGERVTACVFATLRKLEKNCSESFSAYKTAMDNRYHEVEHCRKEQHALEDCWRKFS